MRNFCLFLWLCVKTAFTHTRSILDLASTLAGILIPMLITFYRHYGISGQDNLMNDLFWEIPLGLVAAFGAARLLISPYWVWKQARDEHDVIQLKLTGRKLDVRCGRPGTIKDVPMGDRRGAQQARFLRLRVENNNPLPAYECFGTVRAIRFGDKVVESESIKLPFVPSHAADAESKTIHGDGGYEFLDVIRAYNDNFVRPATKSDNWPTGTEWETLFNDHGRYILTVSVAGKDIRSTICTVAVDWNGVWDQTNIELLKTE